MLAVGGAPMVLDQFSNTVAGVVAVDGGTVGLDVSFGAFLAVILGLFIPVVFLITLFIQSDAQGTSNTFRQPDSPPISRLLVLEARSADRIRLAESVGRALRIALDEERDEENHRDEETEDDREERPERHIQPDCAAVHGNNAGDLVRELVNHLDRLAHRRKHSLLLRRGPEGQRPARRHERLLGRNRRLVELLRSSNHSEQKHRRNHGS